MVYLARKGTPLLFLDVHNIPYMDIAIFIKPVVPISENMNNSYKSIYSIVAI